MTSTVGPTGGTSYVGSDHQQFSIIGQNSSLSSSPLFSLMWSMRDKLIQLAVSIQSKDPVVEKPIIIFITFIQCYILLSSLFLPTITLGSAVMIDSSTNATLLNNTQYEYYANNGSQILSGNKLGYYNYGFYGYWVFNVITFLITFSLDRIPYHVMVGLSFVCEVMILFFIFLTIISFRMMLLSTRHLEKLKHVTRKASGLLVLSSLTMTFILTSFIDCNYWTGKLNRFSEEDVSCFSYENIAYIVICYVAMICLFSCLLFAMFISPNIHPLSKTIFITENSLVNQ